MKRRTFVRTATAASIGTSVISALLQAQSNKKSYVFRGKVELIDAPSKSMTVDGAKVEGWMDAMSMKYQVDNADVFKTVKAGDMIEATVYDGDYKLYKVRVLKPATKK